MSPRGQPTPQAKADGYPKKLYPRDAACLSVVAPMSAGRAMAQHRVDSPAKGKTPDYPAYGQPRPRCDNTAARHHRHSRGGGSPTAAVVSPLPPVTSKKSSTSNHEAVLRAMDRHLEAMGVLHALKDSVHITPEHSVFRGWKVVSLLGSGTFASVYKLENLRTGEKVAAKLLEPQKFGSATQRRVVEMFAKEIRYSAECQCPGVVKLKGVLRGTEGWMILQELVEGGTLWENFETKTDVERFSLFVQLLQSIMSMQSKRIVHRDLKPTNILRSSDRKRLLVTDFGWSETYDDLNLHTHELPGTIEINPPEVLGHKAGQSEKIDNYALAMNMMLLMSRQFVCRDKCLSTADAAKRVLAGIADIRAGKPLPGFTSDAWDVFLGLSNFNPVERFTLSEVLHSKWFVTMLGRYVTHLSRAECHQLLDSDVCTDRGCVLWHRPVRTLAAQLWRSQLPCLPSHRRPLVHIPTGDSDHTPAIAATDMNSSSTSTTLDDGGRTTESGCGGETAPPSHNDVETPSSSLILEQYDATTTSSSSSSTRICRQYRAMAATPRQPIDVGVPRATAAVAVPPLLSAREREVTFDRHQAHKYRTSLKGSLRCAGRRSTATTISTTGSLDSSTLGSTGFKKETTSGSGIDSCHHQHHHPTPALQTPPPLKQATHLHPRHPSVTLESPRSIAATAAATPPVEDYTRKLLLPVTGRDVLLTSPRRQVPGCMTTPRGPTDARFTTPTRPPPPQAYQYVSPVKLAQSARRCPMIQQQQQELWNPTRRGPGLVPVNGCVSPLQPGHPSFVYLRGKLMGCPLPQVNCCVDATAAALSPRRPSLL